jgi:hypothetical protein
MTRRDIRSPPCGAVTATASLFIFDARQDEIHGHSLTQDRGLFARPRPSIYRHRAGFGKGCRKPVSLAQFERKWFCRTKMVLP